LRKGKKSWGRCRIASHEISICPSVPSESDPARRAILKKKGRHVEGRGTELSGRGGLSSEERGFSESEKYDSLKRVFGCRGIE